MDRAEDLTNFGRMVLAPTEALRTRVGDVSVFVRPENLRRWGSV